MCKKAFTPRKDRGEKFYFLLRKKYTITFLSPRFIINRIEHEETRSSANWTIIVPFPIVCELSRVIIDSTHKEKGVC